MKSYKNILFLLLLSPGLALAQTNYSNCPGFSGGWNMMGYGGGWISWVLMIIFWGLIILLILSLIKYISYGPTRHDYHGGHEGMDYKAHDTRSLDIIRERYAKGEITKVQFEEMKKELGK